jgi:hypothetical protein
VDVFRQLRDRFGPDAISEELANPNGLQASSGKSVPDAHTEDHPENRSEKYAGTYSYLDPGPPTIIDRRQGIRELGSGKYTLLLQFSECRVLSEHDRIPYCAPI